MELSQLVAQGPGKHSTIISRISSETWFRALIENSLDTVSLIASDGTILYQSPSIVHILGYTHDELIGRTIFELLHPGDALRIASLFGQLLSNPDSRVRAEFRYQHQDGSYRWIEGVASNFLAEASIEAIVANYRDITERRLAEERLQQLAEIVESSDDAIIGTTLDGIITAWNPGAEQLYGYTAAEALGLHVAFLVPPDRLDERMQLQQRLEQGEHIAQFETVRLAKDQTPVDVALTMSPIKDALGRITGVSTIAHDITDRKRAAQQALELAIEKERVQVLAEFVRNASHDFRTPLSVINTSLYLLGKTVEPNKQHQRLHTIEQQTSRLTRLVEGLLTMTRLDFGGEYEFESLDLNRLVRLIADQACPSSHPQLILDLTEEPLLIHADEAELRRALTEVVANALLYTPDDGTVTVHTYRHNGDIVAEIRDTGIGIGEEDLPHIFERLYRADKARSVQTGGIGLGLSIAKKIVEAHGGGIAVASTLGAGSAFTITLPRLEAYG